MSHTAFHRNRKWADNPDSSKSSTPPPILSSSRATGIPEWSELSTDPSFLLFCFSSNQMSLPATEHGTAQSLFLHLFPLPCLHWWTGIWLQYKIRPYYYLWCHLMYQAFTLVNMSFLLSLPELLSYEQLPPTLLFAQWWSLSPKNPMSSCLLYSMNLIILPVIQMVKWQ